MNRRPVQHVDQPTRTTPLVRWPRHDRGPGFAPFPRHAVLRCNDLVTPAIGIGAVRAALAAHGVAEAGRDEPVGRAVRAVVVATAAGTVVTLEQRAGLTAPRFVVLRRLTRLWDTIAVELENHAPGSTKPG